MSTERPDIIFEDRRYMETYMKDIPASVTLSVGPCDHPDWPDTAVGIWFKPHHLGARLK